MHFLRFLLVSEAVGTSADLIWCKNSSWCCLSTIGTDNLNLTLFQKNTDKIFHSNGRHSVLSIKHLGLLLQDQQAQSLLEHPFLMTVNALARNKAVGSWCLPLNFIPWGRNFNIFLSIVLRCKKDHSPPSFVLGDFGTWKRPLRPGMNAKERSTTEHRMLYVCTVDVDFPGRKNVLLMSYLFSILRAT